MDILVSAYAFEPGRGSEPGVGWMWATCYAAAGHNVTVLFSGQRHSEAIVAAGVVPPDNLKLYPVNFPWPGRGNGSVFFQHIHYLCWLICATRAVHKLTRSGVHFDILHQLTWASLRYPCFLPKAGLVVVGPVGGAELPPNSLTAHFTARARFHEFLRGATLRILRHTGVLRLTLRQADHVLLANKYNEWILPERVRRRSTVLPAIYLHDFPVASAPRSAPEVLRVLFVGRMLEWKGIGLFIETIANLRRRGCEVFGTIMSEQPSKHLKALVKSRNLTEHINFVAWKPRPQVADLMDVHDIFLFPSLHDSGGMVVLESLARGLPVVCLALGGPPQFVTEDCGRIVPSDLPWSETVDQLGLACLELSQAGAYETASDEALRQARYWSSDRLTDHFITAVGGTKPAHV